MKKKVILVIILSIICFIFVGCKKNENNYYSIELKSNHTTGYTWSYQVADEGIVEIENKYLTENQETGMVGVGGIDQFIIKGIKEGTTTIKFTYSQSWDPKDSDKSEVYEIKVEKDLKVVGKNITQ